MHNEKSAIVEPYWGVIHAELSVLDIISQSDLCGIIIMGMILHKQSRWLCIWRLNNRLKLKKILYREKRT